CEVSSISRFGFLEPGEGSTFRAFRANGILTPAAGFFPPLPGGGGAIVWNILRRRWGLFFTVPCPRCALLTAGRRLLQ
ncbi:MAG: hypothetical protein D6812_12085, partial [Deltaproteobacteria bacterium]